MWHQINVFFTFHAPILPAQAEPSGAALREGLGLLKNAVYRATHPPCGFPPPVAIKAL